MYTVTLNLLDSVNLPPREDKPHRRLGVEISYNFDEPGYLALTCENEDRKTVFSAEIPLQVLRTFLGSLP
jgi:hypothetical protein